MAAGEGIDDGYVRRMVNPTTLAPEIVAAIPDDTLPGRHHVVRAVARRRRALNGGRYSTSRLGGQISTTLTMGASRSRCYTDSFERV